MRRVILVLLFGLCVALMSGSVLAQCQSQFPSGYVPFDSISYIAGPDAAGDFLVVGLMTSANFQNLNLVPVPNMANNRFCDTVPLSPTARYFAYVPTAAERLGDFSAFSGLIYDPTSSCTPSCAFYPNGTIPLAELPPSSGTGVFAWRIPPGEAVFVSNGPGGQILKVDGNSGAFTVMFGGVPCEGCPFTPEGMAVGPDNKVYVADPSYGAIYRMDQSGANVETVFPVAGCLEEAPCPVAPQNPVFSSSPAGDLYFADPGNTNDIFMIAEAATTGSEEAFSSTTTVIFSPASSPYQLAGVAFDALDNLLFTDDANGKVWSSPPPYGSVTSMASVSNPGAIALNKATGQVYVVTFVSEGAGGSILPISSLSTPYYVFGTDTPQFMQFDGTGHLFVTTQSWTSLYYYGKLCRVDPPTTSGGSPTATVVLDLNSHLGPLASDYAAGVALVPTSGPTQSVTLSGSGGLASLGWPPGCNPNSNNVPNNCSYTYGLTYPASLVPDGATLTVTPTETSQAAWALRTPAGNGYNGTQIAPVAGLGGDGIIFSAVCTIGSSPCPPGTQTYDATTTWQSTDPNYCLEGPQLLKADPVGSNNWIGTLLSCSDGGDPQPKNTGHTCCTLSDWASVQGVPNTGGVTVTITTPLNGASYVIGQVVDADYSCTPAAGTNPVTACLGTVANGSPIDTSSVGTKTFAVAANVNAGPGGAASTTYNVVAPAASVSPSAMNFGQVPVGRIAVGIVTVTNTGAAAMTISSVKIAPIPGGDSDDFFALSLCPRSPATLRIGKSCVIVVSFIADADDFSPQSATLTITDNTPASPQLVQLAATVVKRK